LVLKRTVWVYAILSALLFSLRSPVWPEEYKKSDREWVKGLLQIVASDVQRHYYDPNLHGVDWEALVRRADDNIEKASSINDAISEIAAVLDSLNDSHTFFIPSPRAYVHDYGFDMKMIDSHCYVIRVEPGSDAQKKGLKLGDEITAVNKHRVSRSAYWRLKYMYEVLQPQTALGLTLKDEAGSDRELTVSAKDEPSSHIRYVWPGGINHLLRDIDRENDLMRVRYFSKGKNLLAAKMPGIVYSPLEADRILGRMRKHKAVVLDLRGTPGAPETLSRLLGGLFETDLKVYDRIGRRSVQSVTVSGRRHHAFMGKLAVLIDSNSMSYSEVFARVVQLQRRGFIIGDHTAGRVMEAKDYTHKTYVDALVLFGTSISVADLRMTDGKSLEHVGVEPDVQVLPTAADLANGRDPAMAKAARLLGVTVTPEEAGAMFPYKGSTEH